MMTGTITIKFRHYWHCGTGQGGAGDLDLVPETEESGLPLVKGKTLKGRLKQTGRERGYDRATLEKLFGKENGGFGQEAAILELTNATMQDDFARASRDFFTETRRQAPQVAALFEDIASTATDKGVAKAKSLRRFRYAVPVTLHATWTLPNDEHLPLLKECAVNLCAIGHGKHDGYGWCKVTFQDPPVSADVAPISSAPRKEDVTAFDLDLELLDDVVFSATSATEGGHRTLDYAPGSALLGAAAKVLFDSLKEREGALALARGDISFGNAYVLTSKGGSTVPVPSSWHHAKNDDTGTIHNFAIVEWEKSPIATKQPVQQRG